MFKKLFLLSVFLIITLPNKLFEKFSLSKNTLFKLIFNNVSSLKLKLSKKLE